MGFHDRTLRFLGVSFQADNVQLAYARIEDLLRAECGSTLVIHANLNTVHRVRSDPDPMAALAHPAALVLFDGIGLKVARWLVTGRWCPDTNGTDLVPAVLSRWRAAPLRVALIGGVRGVALTAAEHLRASHRQILVVGAWNGFEDCESESTLLRALSEARPDVALLGLGTPRQEKLGARWL
jgi:UDP-N-acetyl-D-mannosaminuronic acid transferase (WecB/TagA/CpsF family)